MSGQRGKVVGLLCRVVAITALTFFLALPETVRAHSDIDAVGAAEHELSHKDARISGFNKISGHCHPGLDCFVTAVLSLQPNIKVSSTEASLLFSIASHSHESWMALFDPPPPRIRS
jgi:hypothetical protein